MRRAWVGISLTFSIRALASTPVLLYIAEKKRNSRWTIRTEIGRRPRQRIKTNQKAQWWFRPLFIFAYFCEPIRDSWNMITVHSVHVNWRPRVCQFFYDLVFFKHRKWRDFKRWNISIFSQAWVAREMINYECKCDIDDFNFKNVAEHHPFQPKMIRKLVSIE